MLRAEDPDPVTALARDPAYADVEGGPGFSDDEDTVFDAACSARPRYRPRSDLFHRLHADHEEIRALFDRLAESGPDRRAGAWDELSVRVTAHVQAAREVLRRRVAGSDQACGDEIEAHLVEIDGLPPGSPAFPSAVQRLQQVVEAHIAYEEHDLMPRAEEALRERVLERLAARFERRQRRISRELRAERAVPVTGRNGLYVLAQERRIRGWSRNSRPSSRPPESQSAPGGLVGRSRANAFLQARILVVDDHEIDARHLREILTRARYRRVEATIDPSAVVGLHRKNQYDLILLDLDMPQMDGFAVMEHLKRIDPDGHLPVVAVAGEPSAQLRALRSGARDFLAKPFDVAEVLTRVATVLEVRMPEIARRQRYRGLERDLALAAEICRALQPSSLPSCAGYELSAGSRSADATSGDVYDVVARPDGRLVLLLADATGHGIGPALSATQLRSMVRIALRLGASLDGIVAEADRQLAADLPPDRFVTAFIGELDPTVHTLAYLAPGQGPLLHWHASSQRAEWRHASSPPFGVAVSPFERPLPMVLEVGDVVVLATDGVYERANARGALFGQAGVEAVLREAGDASAEAIGHLIQARTDRHGGARPAEDDATMLVLKRRH